MDWIHLLILAIVQGLTEYLPVSSSAHLILPAEILGWPDQGPLIDLMAHLGSLGAVLVYFRTDVRNMISGSFDLLSFRPERQKTKNAKLALYIGVATPPVLIMGLLMSVLGWDEFVRSPVLLAVAMIFFGIILWLADLWGKQEKTIGNMDIKSAVLIGLAQVIALIPGTSRSGITMTAARGLGYTRKESAHFSMLMSIPVILAGGAFAFIELIQGKDSVATWQDGLLVAFFSLISAYFEISVFMKLVERVSFFPFMVYRVVLGVVLLWWFGAFSSFL